jgi:hypothetical protein
VRTFDVYKHPIRGYEAVKQGFSWPATLFTWIWAFVQRLWWHGIVFLVVFAFLDAAFQGLQSEGLNAMAVVVLLLQIAYSVAFGMMGNQWRSKALTQRGFQHVRPIVAQSPDAAVDIIAREQKGADFA